MKRPTLILAALFLSTEAFAQGPATGFPPYGSFADGSFDAINRQSLNVNFGIPIVSRAGRGMGFSFGVTQNALVWKRVTVGANTSWQPNDSLGVEWGWQKTSMLGNYAHQAQFKYCASSQEDTARLYNWAFIDPSGTRNAFNLNFQEDATACNYNTGPRTGYATNGSGYYIDATDPDTPLIWTPTGHKILPDNAFGGPKITDPNGNIMSVTTDTLGRNTLQIAWTGQTRIDYKVLDQNGQYTGQVTTMYLTLTSIKTKFDCAGVTEFTGSGYLPTSVVLPNGKSYIFEYEDTPSFPGYKTGRIRKVILPTGSSTAGYYEYEYPAPNNGINCADGTVKLLKRRIHDGTAARESVFTRNLGTSVTTVTAPKLSYDAASNESTFTFDGSGRLTSTKIYQGAVGGTPLRTMNSTWGANGTPSASTTILEDNQQSKTEVDLDTFGNVLETREFAFGSGAPGALVRKTTNTYTTIGFIRNRVTQTTVQDGAGATKFKRTTTYDNTALTCENGAIQHDDTTRGCSFTARGNPTTITEYADAAASSGPRTQTIEYDSLGNLRKVTDAGGHAATIAYTDSWSGSCSIASKVHAFPTSIKNALNHETTSVYHRCTGNATSSTDPNLKTTSITYDLLDRPDVTTFPDGGQTDIDYDPNLQWVYARRLREAGLWLVGYQRFDVLGRAWQSQLCEDGVSTCATSVKTDTVFDELGGARSVTNPYRSTLDPTYGISKNKYDALGRVIRLIPPDGDEAADTKVTKIVYAGNTVEVIDPAGKKRKTETDALGRTIRVWEPDATDVYGYETVYQYDTLDNLIRVDQKGGSADTNQWRTRTFTYDSLSHVLTSTTPEAGTVTNAYDSEGRLSTTTDARSITTTLAYDALHRPTTTIYSDGTPTRTNIYDTRWEYGTNTIGRLSQSCWEGSYTNCDWFWYDNVGRMARHEQGGGLWPSALYTYNLAGSLSQLFYYEYYTGHSRLVAYEYDTASRVSRVRETSGAQKTYADSIQYAPHGGIATMLVGNGTLRETNTYNSRLQPTVKLVEKVSPQSNLMRFAYTFTDAQGRNSGNVLAISDTVQSLDYGFTYDHLNRLASAQTTNSNLWGNTYSYDPWGNVYAKSQIGGTQQGEYFSQSITAQNRLSGWSYDAAGNLLNDGAHAYAYNPEGRLKCVDGGSTCTSSAASYTYSNDGRRALRTVGSNTTLYLNDSTGGPVLSEFPRYGVGSGAWQKDYVYLGGRLLATESATQGTRYHFPDHLGTPRVITDSSGAVLSRHDYYPYGKEITTSTDGETHKFTGFEHDAESGLDHTLFRKYSAQCGRWLSPDPYGGDVSNPQSLNRYAYVGNDPVNYTDPLGLFRIVCFGMWNTVTRYERMSDGSLREVGVVSRDFVPYMCVADGGPGGLDPRGGTGGAGRTPRTAPTGWRPVNLDLADACAQMANYAEALAANVSDPTRFANAFGEAFAGVGGPPGSSSFRHMHNVLGNRNRTPVMYGVGQPGHPGAFAHQYRDSTNPAQDQTHHFAAYFQTAFRLGYTAALGAAFGTDSGNSGDLALGIDAAAIGTALRKGSIGTSAIADLIRQLCIGRPQ